MENSNIHKADDITKYLSVQKPQGKGEVRFRRKLAVPVVPGNSLYNMFFDPKLNDSFSKQVASENNRFNRVEDHESNDDGNITIDEPLLIKDDLTAKSFVELYMNNYEKFELWGLTCKNKNKNKNRTDQIKTLQGDKNIISELEYFIRNMETIIHISNSIINMKKLKPSTEADLKKAMQVFWNTKYDGTVKQVFGFRDGGDRCIKFQKDFTMKIRKKYENCTESFIFSAGDINVTLKVSINAKTLNPNGWELDYSLVPNDLKNLFISMREEFLTRKISPTLEKENVIIGQTVDILIDERINNWYRSYKAALNEETYFKSLAKKYDEKQEELQKSFSVDDKNNPDESLNDGEVIEKVSNKYFELTKNLYKVRDRKKEIIREVRTNGYSIDEDNSSFGPKGYDFSIIKGDPIYKDVESVDMTDFLVNNTLSIMRGDQNISEEMLRSIKQEFDKVNNVKGSWSKICEEMNNHATEKSWPSRLSNKMRKAAKKLDGTNISEDMIPLTLMQEKKEESFLLEGLLRNPWVEESSTGNGKVATRQKAPQIFIDKKNELQATQAAYASSPITDVSSLKASFKTKFGSISSTRKIKWTELEAYFKKIEELEKSWLICARNPSKIREYIEWRYKRSKSSNWKGEKKKKSYAVPLTEELTPEEMIIYINDQFPSDFKCQITYDYIRILKDGNYAVVVAGCWQGDESENHHFSSKNTNENSEIRILLNNFVDDCDLFSQAAFNYYENLIKEVDDDSLAQEQSATQGINSLEYLRNYSLTKARISFLLHWRTPAKFYASDAEYIANAIDPHQDPWADFLEELESGNTYNTLSRKVHIDYFTFQRNGYYTQDGVSMEAYIELIKRDNPIKGMRVAIFPVIDEFGKEIAGLRKAVINPEASYEPNPISRLPSVGFIEDHLLGVQWDGFCLGELSHSENLAPGSSKTINIEKTTTLKQRLIESISEEETREMKDTVSIEDKLSEELNNKTSYEEEQKEKVEKKRLDEKKDKTTATKSKEEVSDTSFSIKASVPGAPVGADIDTSKKITKKKDNSRTNEQLVRDSLTTTNDSATKQGRESQTKNLKEKIQKSTSETSQLNKVSINKTNETESSQSSKRIETIQMENNNIGKSISYYFFQLQNIYRMKESIEDVHIVISPAYETIAKSGLRDIRVFHITELANIFDECGADDYALILSLIVYQYVLDNYCGHHQEEGLLCQSRDGKNGELNIDVQKFMSLSDNESTRRQLLESINKDLQLNPVEFKPIINATSAGDLECTVNSGGLYMDTELGKQMATEPYLETRRDIETDLKKAEVEHLRAKTQAGAFYSPPSIIPKDGFISKLFSRTGSNSAEIKTSEK